MKIRRKRITCTCFISKTFVNGLRLKAYSSIPPLQLHGLLYETFLYGYFKVNDGLRQHMLKL